MIEKLEIVDKPYIPTVMDKPLEKKKKKKASLWNRVFNKDKIQKKGKVAVLFLRNNGRADPFELETKRGFFTIEGKTYHEDRDCIYTMGKERIPLALIPEWSLIPIGTKDWEDRDMQERFSKLQDHAMRGIRHAELVRMGDKEQTKINAKAAIAIVIAVIIVAAVIFGYSG